LINKYQFRIVQIPQGMTSAGFELLCIIHLSFIRDYYCFIYFSPKQS